MRSAAFGVLALLLPVVSAQDRKSFDTPEAAAEAAIGAAEAGDAALTAIFGPHARAFSPRAIRSRTTTNARSSRGLPGGSISLNPTP
ncbi:MAG: hypothetical protein ACR2I2_02540 [Bryobacteraceae bacterium]